MNEKDFLRFASPNEQRTITRKNLGLSDAVTIGAVYTFPSSFVVTSPKSYFSPLASCLRANPYLSVLLGSESSDKSWYRSSDTVDLNKHIRILTAKPAEEDASSAIQQLLQDHLDLPFEDEVPPWRLVVLPLDTSKAFLSFAFSHALGDGNTGFSFHHQLLSALQTDDQTTGPHIVHIQKTPLPEPCDTPSRLTLSWTCLLSAILSPTLPTFLSSLLRLPTSTLPDDQTWTGAPVPTLRTNHTRLTLFTIPAPALSKALTVARSHSTKLTALTTHLIVRALTISLPPSANTRNFIASIPLNMRPASDMSPSESGNWVSLVDEKHPAFPPLDPLPTGQGDKMTSVPGTSAGADVLPPARWAAAASTSRLLAERAASLRDHPVGLLRYVGSMREWMLGKMGNKRGVSFEVSNIGVFTPPALIATATVSGEREGDAEGVGIERVVFAQPGAFAGPPLQFNLASVKGGDMVGTVTWSAGALGLDGGEAGEGEFVKRVCGDVEEGFRLVVA
ncbi:hypothetical protein BDZ85DRAFT_256956 [Elsinoe ampelina]|uniref:Alcohol acetyltransferase n=1 Tax=Elsinoe ampelina TaxID=302913 RepID=A0A6A6GMW4_9PEZI|nr:hypothetical protein BDZ85DRAFT_256956 [Elsinoe ampelina]